MRKMPNKDAPPLPPQDDLPDEPLPEDAKTSITTHEPAPARAAPTPPPVPVPAEQFIVEADCQIMYGGYLSTLRRGKIVDSTAYDLDLLRRQGIALRKL